MPRLRRRPEAPDQAAGAAAPAVANGATDEPIEGYDALKTADVVHQLHLHSQVELGAIEDYERANADRQVVFDKLRYLRGNEPFSGYDELEPDGIAAEMKDADLKMRMLVREYERKFKRRDAVLSAIAHASPGREDAPDSA
jgi:hypothetical protein